MGEGPIPISQSIAEVIERLDDREEAERLAQALYAARRRHPSAQVQRS